jgi:hypothetical protein
MRVELARGIVLGLSKSAILIESWVGSIIWCKIFKWERRCLEVNERGNLRWIFRDQVGWLLYSFLWDMTPVISYEWQDIPSAMVGRQRCAWNSALG